MAIGAKAVAVATLTLALASASLARTVPSWLLVP